MTKRVFNITAEWDDVAKTFYSVSDIIGFHIEAVDLETFEDLMMDLAPGLIVTNHIEAADIQNGRPEDLIPTIFWQRPASKAA